MPAVVFATPPLLKLLRVGDNMQETFGTPMCVRDGAMQNLHGQLGANSQLGLCMWPFFFWCWGAAAPSTCGDSKARGRATKTRWPPVK